MFAPFFLLFRLFALCLALLALTPNATWAQDAADPVRADEETEEPPGTFRAWVVVDGEQLFELRGTTALPASERAAKVAERITTAAAASEAPLVEIQIQPSDLGPTIVAENVYLTTVTMADATMEDIDLEVLAQLQAEAITTAIVKYRAGRSEEGRIGSAINVGGWSLLFAVFVVALIFIRRRLKTWVDRVVGRWFASVETATNKKVQAEAIAALVRYGVNIVLLGIFFVGFYYYLSAVLLAFAETRAIAEVLLVYVTEPILNIVFGIIGFVPNMIVLALIAAFTTYFIKGLRVFFDAVEAGTFRLADFEPHWINPTFNICRFVTILLALVFAFPYIPGSDSAAFQGLTIILGATLSLGSNSVVANMLSGLFVIYRRSTNLGDRIKIGEHVGDVVQNKLMETHIKSIKNELISIPNAQLMNSEVINYTHKIDGRGLLIHTTVGIGYEEPSEKIEAMLIEAARRTRDLKKSPPPFVLWAGLADYAINYQINAYSTRGSSIPRILSDLHRNIVAVFNENAVQIMTPSYIADPEVAKIPTAPWDGHLAHITQPGDPAKVR